MKVMRNIGVALTVIGCAYGGFWLTALHDWQAGGRYQQGQLTERQFEEKFPVLHLVFYFWDFNPFANKYGDRAIHPGYFVHRGYRPAYDLWRGHGG